MNTCWQDFDTAIGRWKLGGLEIEQLPLAAVNTLEAGCDGPSLRLLAAMQGSSWSEIEPVVVEVFAERDLSLPSEDEAIKLVADAILGELIDGEIDPKTAAQKLNPLVWRSEGRPAWEDLDAFVGLAGIWDEAEAGLIDYEKLLDHMMSSAREILARGGVRL